VLSLFDGISAGQCALTKAGIKYKEYYAYEIDQWAIKCTLDNFPKTKTMGNVTNVFSNKKEMGKIDLLIGGPECQSYSVAGKMDAVDLWQIELFKECIDTFKPKWFLMENVGSKKSIVESIDSIMEVNHVVIDSKYFSAQNRFRRYWTNIPILPYKDKGITLSDLSSDLPICFSSSGRKGGRIERRMSDNTKAHTMTATGYSRRAFSGYITKELTIRGFSRSELEQLQTFPIGYTKGMTDNQAKKALGNSWTVDAIAHIFSSIKNEKLR
jgi:site-specific DNA-cytosine methylase